MEDYSVHGEKLNPFHSWGTTILVFLPSAKQGSVYCLEINKLLYIKNSQWKVKYKFVSKEIDFECKTLIFFND